MFVALSQFEIANGLTAEVKAAFLNRPHLVENAKGFQRMDVISPLENPSEIWLITYWESEDDYRAWHRSHVFRESHLGIPKGLKLNPKQTKVVFFQHVSS